MVWREFNSVPFGGVSVMKIMGSSDDDDDDNFDSANKMKRLKAGFG